MPPWPQLVCSYSAEGTMLVAPHRHSPSASSASHSVLQALPSLLAITACPLVPCLLCHIHQHSLRALWLGAHGHLHICHSLAGNVVLIRHSLWEDGLERKGGVAHELGASRHVGHCKHRRGMGEEERARGDGTCMSGRALTQHKHSPPSLAHLCKGQGVSSCQPSLPPPSRASGPDCTEDREERMHGKQHWRGV